MSIVLDDVNGERGRRDKPVVEDGSEAMQLLAFNTVLGCLSADLSRPEVLRKPFHSVWGGQTEAVLTVAINCPAMGGPSSLVPCKTAQYNMSFLIDGKNVMGERYRLEGKDSRGKVFLDEVVEPGSMLAGKACRVRLAELAGATFKLFAT